MEPHHPHPTPGAGAVGRPAAGTTRTVTSADGTTIAYQTDGSGPPLVLVAGALTHRTVGPLGPLAALLAADFTVVTYDRRGRGASGDTPPHAVAREVEDLAAVAEAVGGAPFAYGLSSGGLLALQARAAGVPFPGLVVFEPPFSQGADRATTAELAALVAAGRGHDAVGAFLGGMGMPDEVLAGMDTVRPALDAMAPTVVYECRLCDETTSDVLAGVAASTLVLDSAGTDGRLSAWSQAVADALPRAAHRSLPGDWHGVRDADLARAITDFLLAT